MGVWAKDKQMDGKTLQTMEEKNEGRGERTAYEESDKETNQQKNRWTQHGGPVVEKKGDAECWNYG